jgi:hypothetical protein
LSEPGKPPSEPTLGSNLPDFRAVQLEFAAHIRNPSEHPKPADVDERRMRVYRELVYNNIEGFLAGAFPIAKKLLHLPRVSGTGPNSSTEDDSGRWHELARQFVHQHASSSPYFLEVSQEFLEFLGQFEQGELPPFLLELCHYEWVELALRVDERDIPSAQRRAGELLPINPDGDLLTQCPVVSPLAKSLAYGYAVHRIQGDMPISSVAPAPTYLIVFRDPQDQVRFLEINAITAMLLELLDGTRSGADALRDVAAQLAAPELEGKVLAQGAQTLNRLRDRSIVLGTLSARVD